LRNVPRLFCLLLVLDLLPPVGGFPSSLFLREKCFFHQDGLLDFDRSDFLRHHGQQPLLGDGDLLRAEAGAATAIATSRGTTGFGFEAAEDFGDTCRLGATPAPESESSREAAEADLFADFFAARSSALHLEHCSGWGQSIQPSLVRC
jgi:hypothetical protein